MIVLIGFMGAGKSAVGRLLAPRLGLAFADTDASIEGRTGTTIAAIFEEHGESAFREIEREVVSEVLAGDDAVVALGGGAVTDPATAAALEWATVVYLKAGYAESMRRIGADPGRPLLSTADPKALFVEREGLYERLADVTVATHGKSAEEVADELGRLLSRGDVSDEGVRRVVVRTASRSYEVVVGAGLAGRFADFLPDLPDAETAFVLTHESLEEGAGAIKPSLAERGFEVRVASVPEGEGSKSLAAAAEIYERLAEAGAHRHDLLVGYGGGVITDLTGYVASTYNRGMPVAYVATTLLAQVDAAIGGKTGVNLPRGKNLVGTFYQPIAVVCDVATLRTLPDEELRSGLAEVVKYGLIADVSLLEVVVAKGRGLLARDEDLLVDVVSRCAAIKAQIVSADEKEAGERAHLNYGHTFGHAIEQGSGYRMRHGEAISLGMMAAAYLARELLRIDDDAVDLHRRALEAVGLPTRATLDVAALEEAWTRDKKYRHGVRFVLLAEIGKPEAGVEVDRSALLRAVDRLSR